jgi:hypothetical protein
MSTMSQARMKNLQDKLEEVELAKVELEKAEAEAKKDKKVKKK